VGEKVVVFQRLGTSIDARLAAFAQMPVGHALIRMIKTLYVGGSYLVAFAIVVLIGGLTGWRLFAAVNSPWLRFPVG
jgi:hypothetical protein